MIKPPKCYIEIYSKYFLRGQLKNLISAIYHYIFNYCLKTLPPYTKNVPEDCSSSRTLNQCSKLSNLDDDVSCSLSSMQNGNLFNAKYCIFQPRRIISLLIMAFIFIGCSNKITFLHIFDFWSTFYISDCYSLQFLSTKIYNFVNWLPADDKEIFVLKMDHVASGSIKSI